MSLLTSVIFFAYSVPVNISVICAVIRKVLLFAYDCPAVVTCRNTHLLHLNSMPVFVVLLIFAVCAVSEKNANGSVARSKIMYIDPIL